MPSNVRQLLDNGVPVYPITDKSLVIGLQDVPFESYVVAWDGASTPVVANIPAGVVVTYNTTDYTGTLAAGSATAPYLYLVASTSQQGEYDRYITTHPGSSYVWTPLGSTAPVSPVIADDLVTNDSSKALSAKQGKILGDKTSELEAKVDGYSFSDVFTISATGEHSSNSDRITFQTPILPGDYTFLVETGTTGNSGSVGLFARKVGAGSNTNIGSTPIGTPKNITLTDAIESLGIYMSSTVNTHTGTMPLTIITQTSIDQRIDEVEKDKEYILNNYFVGKGGTYNSTKLYGLKKGVQYRIVLQNPANLTDTTSDTSVAKFDAKYEKTNGTLTNLVRVAIGSGNVLDSYTFTIGNDYKDNGFVEIGGRAVAGTIVNFSIVEEKANEYTTYGVVRCSTAEGTAQKDVTIPGLINVNTEKIRFVLIFSKVTTISATLSINGDAAKALYYNGARANSNNSWSAGEKLDVVYNANYPGYFATTITNLTHTINADSPSKEKTVSEKGIVDYVAGRTNDSVKDFNLDKESGIVSAASRSPLVYEKTNDEQCPVFSVLTDLHSDLPRFKRACEFADLEEPILATLCLGDLINTSNAQNPYPLILDYTKPVISITGNHEVLKKTGQGITGWSETDIIDNMYNPTQVAHNGETHPTDKCYWYKDFSKTIDSTTRTLRIIGLHQYESNGTGEQNSGAGKDVCYYTQGQIDWLIERLNEVDSNTWVMILVHYAPTASMTRIECPFTPSSSFNFPLQGGSNTGGPSSMSDDEFIPKIVQAWIDGTTLNISCDITVGETTTTITAVKGTAFSAHTKKFVGYFSGHTHRDFVGKLTNYQKQLQFAFITTSAVSTQQSCDIGRSTSGRSQDCFTVVGVDWFKNSVSLIRVGADITTDMRERKWYNIPIPD